MSREALSEFLTKMAGDTELQEELRAVTGEDGDSVPSHELVSLAAKHGYDFTVEDIRATDLELEDAELEEVAGGAGYLKWVDGGSMQGWIGIVSYSSIISYGG